MKDILSLIDWSNEMVLELIKHSSAIKKNPENYSERFKNEHIQCFNKLGIGPREANNYPNKLSGRCVLVLYTKGMTSEECNKYPERFKYADLWSIQEQKITPEIAKAYPSRFSGRGIAKLYSYGITAEKAGSYPDNFSVRNILKLHFKAAVERNRK